MDILTRMSAIKAQNLQHDELIEAAILRQTESYLRFERIDIGNSYLNVTVPPFPGLSLIFESTPNINEFNTSHPIKDRDPIHALTRTLPPGPARVAVLKAYMSASSVIGAILDGDSCSTCFFSGREHSGHTGDNGRHEFECALTAYPGVWLCPSCGDAFPHPTNEEAGQELASHLPKCLHDLDLLNQETLDQLELQGATELELESAFVWRSSTWKEYVKYVCTVCLFDEDLPWQQRVA